MKQAVDSEAVIWSYGIAMMDVVVWPLAAWPQRGGLVVAERGMLVPGGVALNTAVTVARLGNRAGLVAAVGNDAAADGVRAYLEQEQVDTRLLLQKDTAATGFCIVGIGSDGEKSLIAHLGANRFLLPARIPWEGMAAGDILHLGGCFGFPELSGTRLVETIAAAKSRGLRISLESTWDVTGGWLRGVEPSLPSVDVFMASDNEAEGMTGLSDPAEACRALADLGPPLVVVKTGRGGCWVLDDGQVRHFPAFLVEAVDTTGAGDSFCGGFLVGLEHFQGVAAAADFANAVAAMNVTAVGSTAGIRSLEETLAFIQATPRGASQP